ncbi:unnamed protein product [Vitrella brassicaformis CCMP3155]|uniref:Dynein regulatory complex subunit 7 n=1 Tax=Vitrella brassicaformis (strain CCMP3155) TaxID=1169540 RepID=A0A0G4G4P5_VITBC|nr:unnamed protein product [Vitrella brassicaformis CCMP3155]|eukprot:CEM23237.1 unnamed protein product [Vitrella brassicaformis CCMP3155]
METKEKIVRSRRFASENLNCKREYRESSLKEKTLMEQVQKFEVQFRTLYGPRFLFLAPPNEFGINKFLPTTVRPTKLSYRELYDYRSCAAFLSDLLGYEHLNPPDEHPPVIPAPATVLRWQTGDCFDFSIVLASLLIGVGYDAYCVSGTAPRTITLRDEATFQCPEFDETTGETIHYVPLTASSPTISTGAKLWAETAVPSCMSDRKDGGGEGADDGVSVAPSLAAPKEGEKDPTDVVIKPKEAPKSQFIEKMQREKDTKEAEEKRIAQQSDSEDEPEEDKDPMEGKRLHAWVLLRRGPRDVSDDLYIEPTTGRLYSPQACPYHSIDLIWNHKNLWVNLQRGPMNQLSLELFDSRCYEYVMPDIRVQDRDADKDNDDANENEDEAIAPPMPAMTPKSPHTPALSAPVAKPSLEAAAGGEQTHHPAVQTLDLPPSWSEPIEISREKFQQRLYSNETTKFYEKLKIERYTAYSQADGLVTRVSVYKDTHRTVPLTIRESFSHRRDKLVQRVRIPREHKLIEIFAPGRPGALKRFEQVEARRREMTFYNSRLDGLIKHVELIGEKIFEYFEEREDRMTYHSITLDPGLKNAKDFLEVETGELPIRKMTQKFARKPDVLAEQDVQKLVFYLSQGKVCVYFHTDPGRVVTPSLMFQKVDSVMKLDEDYLRFKKGPPIPLPAPQQIQKLLHLQKDCLLTWKATALSNAYSQHATRRQEELKISSLRYAAHHQQMQHKAATTTAAGAEPGAASPVAAPGAAPSGPAEPIDFFGPNGILEKSVYDLAREQAQEESLGEGTEEEKQAEEAKKVDTLAPYLLEFPGKTIDAMTAEMIAKKCKNDFRKRLLDRAAIIQRRLEEEHDQLRKRRAALQRRAEGPSPGAGPGAVDKDEKGFEQYQSEAMFRIQILEQRLARHEMQAIKKFAELEKFLAEDPRLAAMWQKADAGRTESPTKLLATGRRN